MPITEIMSAHFLLGVQKTVATHVNTIQNQWAGYSESKAHGYSNVMVKKDRDRARIVEQLQKFNLLIQIG